MAGSPTTIAASAGLRLLLSTAFLPNYLKRGGTSDHGGRSKPSIIAVFWDVLTLAETRKYGA